MILKPELPTVSWVMSEKCSNGYCGARKSWIMTWKWFIQLVLLGTQRHAHKQGTFPPYYQLWNGLRSFWLLLSPDGALSIALN